MATDRESLASLYAELDDAELLRRVAHDELAGMPREVAQTELLSRGHPNPAHAPESRPPAGTEFPANAFAANPYQPPHARSDDASAAAPGRSGISGKFWWAYVAILGVLALRNVYFAAQRPGGLMLTPLLVFGAMAWNCAGLVGWRLRKALLWRWMWAASAVFVWLIVALMAVISSVLSFGAANDPAQWPLVWLSASVFFTLLPMAWGVSTYAFREESLW